MKKIMFIFLILLMTNNAFASRSMSFKAVEKSRLSINWEWENPYPDGNSIAAVWSSKNGEYHAVGEAGTHFIFDKNKKLIVTKLDSKDWFSSVWGDDNLIFAAGYQGLIARFDSETLTWEKYSTGVTNDLNGIWGSSTENIYAVGDRGTILHFDGNTWTQEPTGSTDLLFGIWGSDANNIYAVGGRGVVIHFNGKEWSILKVDRVTHYVGVWGRSDKEVYIYGDRGTVMFFDGSIWHDISLPANIDRAHGGILVRGVIKGDALYAVSDAGTIFKQVDGNWKLLQSINMEMDRMMGISGGNGDYVLFGDSGRLYSFSDEKLTPLVPGRDNTDTVRASFHKVTYGSKKQVLIAADGGLAKFGKNVDYIHAPLLWDVWKVKGSISNLFDKSFYIAGAGGFFGRYISKTKIEKIDTGFNNDIFGLWGDGKNIYGVGSKGMIFKYNKNGIQVIREGANALYGVWGRSKNDIYAVGDNGEVLHFNGSSWEKEDSFIKTTLFTVGGDEKSIYAAGDNGVILVKNDSWSRIEFNHAAPLYDILFLDSSNQYFVGSRGTMIHLHNNRAGIVNIPTFNDLYGIALSKDKKTIITVGDNGTILRGKFK